jgi:predicted permease
MSLPPGVRRLLRRRDPEREVADELSFHFEQAVAELQLRGLSEAEAEREAARRFGDVVAYRRELERLDRGRLQAERGVQRWEAARDVVIHAVRSLRRAPALAAAVVLTLALGLGANVTVYGIADRLLLSPPPHLAEPGSVRRIMVDEVQPFSDGRTTGELLSYPDFQDMRHASTLADAAVWQETVLTTGHGLEARQLDGVLVSGSYFRLRGVQPVLGRLLSEEDNASDAPTAAVISYELWQREHGGRPDAMGSTLSLGTTSYTIIGVLPPGFTTLRLGAADVWLPLERAATRLVLDGRRWLALGGVARLREGVGEVAAAAELTSLLRRGQSEIELAQRDPEVLLTPVLQARGPLAPPEARVAGWLVGVALVVLLIACVNVANLLLARMVRQRRETAVRLALGISRARLVGQFLVEGMLLGLVGGAAALLLAYWTSSSVGTLLLPDVAWDRLGWPARLVPLALLAAVTTGVVSALIPALQTTRTARSTVSASLRDGDAGTPAGRRLRMGLSLAQAALSVVLLVGAGLFVRSLEAVRSLDLGYRLEHLHYVQTTFASGSVTGEEAARIRQDVLKRLRGHPAVSGAAAASTAPFRTSMMSDVRLPGRDSLPRVGGQMHRVYNVTPEYFGLLGMRFIAGRPFDERDVRAGGSVVVVNESMARALWPEGDAIGACVLIASDDCSFVTGVVRDARFSSIREEGVAQYFTPLRTHGSTFILARARPGSAGVAEQLREAATAVDPRIRLVQVTAARDAFAPQEREWRLGAALFTAFGLLALVVAAMGLYAMMAFDVGQRTREIGVRSALGASRSSIVGLVVGRAVAVAGAGVLLGGAAAALLTPRLEPLLFGVRPHDLMTFGLVSACLLTVAVLAAAIPARRAAAVDPAVALRGD